MKTNDFMSQIQAWGKSFSDYSKTGIYASIFIEKTDVLKTASFFLDNGYFLEDIAGVDLNEGVMLVYHFDRHDRSERIAVRVLASSGSVPSISSVFSGADWHERECFDFFGTIFENHPNLRPLLLPDDIGINPLIKVKGKQSLYFILPFEQLSDSVSGGSKRIP